jgi:hypothetical protein
MPQARGRGLRDLDGGRPFLLFDVSFCMECLAMSDVMDRVSGLYSVDHWLAHRLSFARRWR